MEQESDAKMQELQLMRGEDVSELLLLALLQGNCPGQVGRRITRMLLRVSWSCSTPSTADTAEPVQHSCQHLDRIKKLCCPSPVLELQHQPQERLWQSGCWAVKLSGCFPGYCNTAIIKPAAALASLHHFLVPTCFSPPALRCCAPCTQHPRLQEERQHRMQSDMQD